MKIKAQMTCPICKNTAKKENTEDPFVCPCGWKSN